MTATYDAIVIGAGHNGLTLAAYLQRAGLSTLVLEQCDRVGGFARTAEPSLPGYFHNPHANFLSYLEINPVVRDFDLEANGLRTVLPDAQHGICFSDGRPPVVLHRNALLDRTHASLARYSARDAATYVSLKSAVNLQSSLLAEGMYAPAQRTWFRRQSQALGDVLAQAGIRQNLGTETAASLIDSLFESPEVRTLFYQLAAEFGTRIDEVGGDLGFLGVALWLVGQWRLPLGGMQVYSDALLRAARLQGVKVATSSRVAKIVTLNGRARGVFISGHGMVHARKVVASSASVADTLLGLLPAADLSAIETKSLREFRAAPATSLASLMFCLSEPPDYASARWDADINRCFHTMVGFEGPQETLSLLRQIEAGLLPAPAAAVRVNSLWDARQAPPGHHVAGSDVLMPPVAALTDQDWTGVAESYAEAFLGRWRAFAPNLTPDQVLASLFERPGTYERKMRFREGADQYRTEVRRLYLCGASTYPGGGVHGACGYNAYQVIAEDLGLSSVVSG